MWNVHCLKCGVGKRVEAWKAALRVAVHHAEQTGHYRWVLLYRAGDLQEYILTAWGVERRNVQKYLLTKRVA